MTPAEYRALAARVETEKPSDALIEDVARAFKWFRHDMSDGIWWSTPDRRLRRHRPHWLYRIDDAAAEMPDGWEITLVQRGAHMECHADPRGWEHGTGPQSVEATAPTEPRARVAAALRARAADLEAGG